MAIRVTTPEAALAEAARAGGFKVGGKVEVVVDSDESITTLQIEPKEH